MSDPAGTVISGARTLAVATLDESARRLARGLLDLGLGHGERVALLLRNDLPYLVAHQACLYLDVVPVPVNWHLAPPEISYILGDCMAGAVIAHADLLTDAVRDVVGERALLVVETPPEIRVAYGIAGGDALPRGNDRRWDAWLAACAPLAGPPTGFRPPLFYTSGTSGHPKAVDRGAPSPDAIARIAQRTRFAWGFDGTPARSVMTGPLYHSAPNGYAHLVLQSGGLLMLQPRFDAEELLRWVEQHRITHLHLVPTMFVRLLDLPGDVKSRYDLSSLRHVTHGAAPCPADVKRAMIDWWGPVIHEYYAMTETGILCCSTSGEWLAHPASVGRPAPGVSISIRDADGNDCAPGSTGVICVAHEATPGIGYFNAAEKSADLHHGGMLVTGDVGFLDADGFLYLSDRRSDLVISGGVNIYPAEVEAQIMTHPDVRDCAVFGVPDRELGEALVAVVEAAPGVDTAAVTAHLAGRIARFKIPRVIEFIGALPREDSGKIRKRLLRDAWLQRQPPSRQ